ncbi:hypothetical protein LMG29542_07425 [Paraburkholderia humisilvae]|uniref:Uncharacterized protein n=1 Tax=Paraburkholderia humisilvae TaxID=627669 RepID=A0A6J5F4I8_9BURK|nr:hypothetical protein LMG29542_07425 [Paraburkholderia humisilvae]
MTASCSSSVALLGGQNLKLQGLIDNKSWPAGYEYVQSIVQQKMAKGTGYSNDLQILSNWLSNAATRLYTCNDRIRVMPL